MKDLQNWKMAVRSTQEMQSILADPLFMRILSYWSLRHVGARYAEDAASEAVVRMLQPDFANKPVGSLSGFVQQILRNIRSEWWRKKAPLFVRDEDLDLVRGPDKRLACDNKLRWVNAALLSELAGPQKLVVLNSAYGIPERVAAEGLDTSVPTVNRMKKRGWEALARRGQDLDADAEPEVTSAHFGGNPAGNFGEICKGMADFLSRQGITWSDRMIHYAYMSPGKGIVIIAAAGSAEPIPVRYETRFRPLVSETTEFVYRYKKATHYPSPPRDQLVESWRQLRETPESRRGPFFGSKAFLNLFSITPREWISIQREAEI